MSVIKKDNRDLEPLAFSWPVPESGFEWRQLIAAPLPGKPDRSPSDALVVRELHDSVKLYNPMQSEDLFLQFAQCGLDREDILVFANKYGWLSGRTSFIRSTLAKKGQAGFWGDSLSFWRKEITDMKDGVDLWWALSRPPSALQKYIGQPAGHLIWHATSSRVVTLRHLGSHSWAKDDLSTPAKAFLVEHINKGIGERIAPRLTVDSDGKIRRSLRPAHLLGALWYQFYLAFTGETRLGRCAECGELMNYARRTKQMHSSCANKKRQAEFKERHRNAKTSRPK